MADHVVWVAERDVTENCLAHRRVLNRKRELESALRSAPPDIKKQLKVELRNTIKRAKNVHREIITSHGLLMTAQDQYKKVNAPSLV